MSVDLHISQRLFTAVFLLHVGNRNLRRSPGFKEFTLNWEVRAGKRTTHERENY